MLNPLVLCPSSNPITRQVSSVGFSFEVLNVGLYIELLTKVLLILDENIMVIE